MRDLVKGRIPTTWESSAIVNAKRMSRSEKRIKAEKAQGAEFFSLAEHFRNTADPDEIKRLGDEIGRMIFKRG